MADTTQAVLSELSRVRREHWAAQLERHAAARPAGAAIRYRGATTTWRQLDDRVRRLAGAFSRRGVGQGDRVAVLAGNCPEFVESVIAANSLGAIAVPVNFRLSPPEAAYVLRDSGAALLVVDGMCGPTAAAALAQLAERPAVIYLGAGGSPVAGGEAYEDVLAEPGPTAERADIPEDSPALIMYTSGTTGRPRGAVLTHLNLHAQCLTSIRMMRLVHDDEVGLVTSPLFHIAGIGSVAPAFLAGNTTVIVPTGAFSAAGLLDLVEAERVTSMFLVPALWQAVCDDPSLAGRDLSSLRTIGWGAAPASDALLRQLAAAFPGALIIALFGQTEMSPVTCALHGRDALRKLGSVGRPVPGVVARVVDTTMRDVAAGEVGEIVYRGTGLMREYWNNPAATAEAFHGGWFHSGDLVARDEEGYVWVVDRVKDMIISGGENIYCAEVENALAEHPSVAEVSVVGRPDPRWGESPVAFVALRPPATALGLEELRAHAASRLARYKLPAALVLVDALPRNASGKVVKGELRALCPPAVAVPGARPGQ